MQRAKDKIGAETAAVPAAAKRLREGKLGLVLRRP